MRRARPAASMASRAKPGEGRRLGRRDGEELLRARPSRARRADRRALRSASSARASLRIAAAVEREGERQDRDAQRVVLRVAERLAQRRHRVVESRRAARPSPRAPPRRRRTRARPSRAARFAAGARGRPPRASPGWPVRARTRAHARSASGSSRPAAIARLAVAERDERLVELAQRRERPPFEHARRRVPGQHARSPRAPPRAPPAPSPRCRRAWTRRSRRDRSSAGARATSRAPRRWPSAPPLSAAHSGGRRSTSRPPRAERRRARPAQRGRPWRRGT